MIVRKRWTALVAGGALGLALGPAACTLLYPLDGYGTGTGTGSSSSAAASSTGTGGTKGGTSSSTDTTTAASSSTGHPDCNNGANACKANLGFICGQSTQFDGGVHGVPDCLYACDAGMPCADWCPNGCVVEEAGVNDHCAGQPAQCH